VLGLAAEDGDGGAEPGDLGGDRLAEAVPAPVTTTVVPS